MEPGGNGITFQEADRRYAELKRQHEGGELSDEEFAARLRELMVQDDEDRWWAKSLRTGEWHRWDGERYVKDTPPYTQAPTEAPLPGETVRRGDPSPAPAEQDTRPPTVETQPDRTVRPEGVEDGGRRSRGVARILLAIGGLLVVMVLVVVGLLVLVARVGPGGPTVPDVIGQTESEAKRSAGNDYKIDVTSVRVTDKPKGTIIDQNPEAREPAEPGSTISVVVSAGEPPDPGDIFRDDFSSTSSGWDRGRQGGEDDPYRFFADYKFGLYRMYSGPPDSAATILIDEAGTPEDVIVEVNATVGGDTPGMEAAWGLVCRARDYDNYYSLVISPNGGSAIWKLEDNEWTNLAYGSVSEAVRGTEENHLRADCLGNKLTLYVNDQKVVETEDSTFDSGQVGLYTEDSGGKGLEVLFDDFLVSSP